MHLRRIATAVALSLAGIASASAQQADLGAYVGFHIGQAKVNIDTGPDAADFAASGLGNTGFTTDETSTAWRALVGYRFHRNFAAEAAYTSMGDFHEKTTVTSVSGIPITPTPVDASFKVKNTFTLAGVGILPLQQFSPYAKLGLYSTKLEVTSSIPTLGFSQSQSVSSTGLLWGLGIGFDVTKNVTVRGEYEVLNKVGDKDKTGQSDVSFLSIGLLYKFQ
jgi:opacity protein-like surface antigen